MHHASCRGCRSSRMFMCKDRQRCILCGRLWNGAALLCLSSFLGPCLFFYGERSERGIAPKQQLHPAARFMANSLMQPSDSATCLSTSILKWKTLLCFSFYGVFTWIICCSNGERGPEQRWVGRRCYWLILRRDSSVIHGELSRTGQERNSV